MAPIKIKAANIKIDIPAIAIIKVLIMLLYLLKRNVKVFIYDEPSSFLRKRFFQPCTKLIKNAFDVSETRKRYYTALFTVMH